MRPPLPPPRCPRRAGLVLTLRLSLPLLLARTVFRHPLLDSYEFYWRVEPSVKFYCDIGFDPFRRMKDEGKVYGWVVSLYECASLIFSFFSYGCGASPDDLRELADAETIKTLWSTTKGALRSPLSALRAIQEPQLTVPPAVLAEFIDAHPEHVAEPNLMPWISNDGGETYNGCHFWFVVSSRVLPLSSVAGSSRLIRPWDATQVQLRDRPGRLLARQGVHGLL